MAFTMDETELNHCWTGLKLAHGRRGLEDWVCLYDVKRVNSGYLFRDA